MPPDDMMKTITPKDPEEGQQGLEPEPQPAFDLEVHPLAESFPVMDNFTYRCLKASIQADGLLHPLWIYEGKLLDGHNRKEACEELGIVLKDTDFRVFTGTPDEALRHVVRLNVTTRRQITFTQRIAIASDLANIGHGGDRSKLHTLGLAAITMERAGDMCGVSTSSISEFRKIKDEQLISSMRAGSLSVWEAKALVAKAEVEQAKAAAREAQRILREKKKAAPGSTNGGGGDKDKKAQPGKKLSPARNLLGILRACFKSSIKVVEPASTGSW
jgi:hypothetical protein